MAGWLSDMAEEITMQWRLRAAFRRNSRWGSRGSSGTLIERSDSDNNLGVFVDTMYERSRPNAKHTYNAYNASVLQPEWILVAGSLPWQ